ncbi:MAG: hypothetical protein AAFP92_11010 [Bacteroidota bacterium]
MIHRWQRIASAEKEPSMRWEQASMRWEQASICCKDLRSRRKT